MADNRIVVDGIEYVRAYPVAKPHCPVCGRRSKGHWSPQQTLDAILRFADEHGRPPTMREWKKSTPTTPCFMTITRLWGGWGNAIRHAGLEPGRPFATGAAVKWNRDAIVAAILEWTAVHGRPPRAKDWKLSGGDTHPVWTRVKDVFGSWNAGLCAAGVTDIRPPQGGRSRRRRTRAESALRELRPSDPAVLVPVAAARRVLEQVYQEGWSQGDVAHQTGVAIRTQWRICSVTRVAPSWRKGAHRTSDPVVGTKYGFVVPALQTVTLDTLDKLVTGLGLDLSILEEAA